MVKEKKKRKRKKRRNKLLKQIQSMTKKFKQKENSNQSTWKILILKAFQDLSLSRLKNINTVHVLIHFTRFLKLCFWSLKSMLLDLKGLKHWKYLIMSLASIWSYLAQMIQFTTHIACNGRLKQTSREQLKESSNH